jgi:hypothetical protein
MFDEAKELGERGLYWLKIHLANLAGYDKASFSDRVEFANQHKDDIFDSADKPLEVIFPYVAKLGRLLINGVRVEGGGFRQKIHGNVSRLVLLFPKLSDYRIPPNTNAIFQWLRMDLAMDSSIMPLWVVT